MMRDENLLREEVPRTVSQRTVAWATALVMLGAAGIFGLGFVIGGRMARLDIAHEPLIDPIARLDVQRKLHDDLTFYDDLTAKQKVRPADAVAAAPAPVVAVQVPKPQPPTPSAASGSKSTAAPGPSAKAAPAARTLGAANDAAKQTPPKYQGVLGLHDGPARPGEYTVQVSSHQSHEEARASCGALERKGFRPFVVKTDLGLRGTWYRVRVGRFIDESKAKQAKQSLAQADIPSWVLRTE